MSRPRTQRPVPHGTNDRLWRLVFRDYQSMERGMQTKFASAMIVMAALALPVAAQAQGTVRGAQEGADQGNRAAGPIGAIVGGAVGAATGTVGGILGVDDRPRFREYVVRERRPSYVYRDEVRVGAVLPEAGVTYCEIPAESRAPGYPYTIGNDRPGLVEPRSRRIVEIID